MQYQTNVGSFRKGKDRHICNVHTVCNKHFFYPSAAPPPNLPKLLVSVSITRFDCNDQSHVIVFTVMNAVYHFKYYTAVTGNPTLNTYTFHS